MCDPSSKVMSLKYKQPRIGMVNVAEPLEGLSIGNGYDMTEKACEA